MWWLAEHQTGYVVLNIPTLIQQDACSCGIIALNMLLHHFDQSIPTLTSNDQLVEERLKAVEGLLEHHADLVNNLALFIAYEDSEEEREGGEKDNASSDGVALPGDTDWTTEGDEAEESNSGIPNGGEETDNSGDDPGSGTDEDDDEYVEVTGNVEDDNDAITTPYKDGDAGELTQKRLGNLMNSTPSSFRQATLTFKPMTAEERTAKSERDRLESLEYKRGVEEAKAEKELSEVQEKMVKRGQNANRQQRYRDRKVEQEIAVGKRDAEGKKLRKVSTPQID
jgi:hypothetical protein